MFDLPEKAPWPSRAWPGPWSMLRLHEFECERFDRWAATAPHTYDFPNGNNYGSSLFCRILSLFILTMITSLEYILFLVLRFRWPFPRCRCARLSKRGGEVLREARCRCDRFRRLRRCWLLAGNLSSRKKRNRLSHFRHTPHRPTLICGEPEPNTHTSCFLPRTGYNGRSHVSIRVPSPCSTVRILPRLLLRIRPRGSLRSVPRNVIWPVLSCANLYLRRLFEFLTPGWSEKVGDRCTRPQSCGRQPSARPVIYDDRHHPHNGGNPRRHRHHQDIDTDTPISSPLKPSPAPLFSHPPESYSLSPINVALNLPTMAGSDTNGSDGPITPLAPLASPFRPVGIMPRPGQPGAMEFDGRNITEFLDEWNLECEDFGLGATQRCARFPNYCIPTIKDTVKILPGYLAKDWVMLQNDLRKLYWPQDKPKNTMSALDSVVKEAQTGDTDLNVYVLKYSSISEALVAAHALSTLDRVARMLDGLSEDLRRKVIRHCTKQRWKLSTQDTGTVDPDFDAIKAFILTEAQTEQTMSVYDSERSVREHGGSASRVVTTPSATLVPTPVPTPVRIVPTPVASPAPTPTPAPAPPAPSTVPDPIVELTKQFSRLALAMEANMQGRPPATNSPAVNASNAPGSRPRQCMWCDSVDHTRRECAEFKEALRSQRVALNERGRVIFNGEELPLMWGKGGMKRFLVTAASVVTSPAAAPAAVINNNIKLEPLAALGPESSVMVTTLDFEKGTRTDEIVDVSVEEKRRRDEVFRRRVRPRHEDDLPDRNRPPNVSSPSDRDSITVAREPATASHSAPPNSMPRTDQDATMFDTPTAAQKKYRLASDLSQTVSVAQIGEKIMDTPVQLSVRDVLAVSSEVSGYLHEQTRKRRVPIDAPTPATPIAAAPTSASPMSATPATITEVHVNSTTAGHLKRLYACPSPQAKVTLDRDVKVTSLLDGGSEVNIMPRRVFERSDLAMDPDIHWRIDTYNTATNEYLDDHGPIGVCRDVSVDIGGVDVKQHIFVVEHSNHDLILGRPWERLVRAVFINEDDGSLTVRIRSVDDQRVAQFCAVRADHERNREFAKPSEGGTFGGHPLKA